MAFRSTLATYWPCGSTSQGGMPMSSAISAIGLSVARRAISRAPGIGMRRLWLMLPGLSPWVATQKGTMEFGFGECQTWGVPKGAAHFVNCR